MNGIRLTLKDGWALTFFIDVLAIYIGKWMQLGEPFLSFQAIFPLGISLGLNYYFHF
jgi:hypothetical protein